MHENLRTRQLSSFSGALGILPPGRWARRTRTPPCSVVGEGLQRNAPPQMRSSRACPTEVPFLPVDARPWGGTTPRASPPCGEQGCAGPPFSGTAGPDGDTLGTGAGANRQPGCPVPSVPSVPSPPRSRVRQAGGAAGEPVLPSCGCRGRADAGGVCPLGATASVAQTNIGK